MILADTSIWIDHFSRNEGILSHHLNDGTVLIHELVISELSMGNLRNRDAILAMLATLPEAPCASHAEVRAFVTAQNLFGIGIGFIDAHLLAAVRLAPGTRLWTRDKRLAEAAARLNLAVPAN